MIRATTTCDVESQDLPPGSRAPAAGGQGLNGVDPPHQIENSPSRQTIDEPLLCVWAIVAMQEFDAEEVIVFCTSDKRFAGAISPAEDIDFGLVSNVQTYLRALETKRTASCGASP